jgi:endonuclease I
MLADREDHMAGRSPRKSRKKLTENDWERVFAARCQSKQGSSVSDEERSLVGAAHEDDRERYKAMEKDVFNATVPFGSTRRWV